MMEKLDGDDAERLQRIRDMIGPQQIDSQIRQAIQLCWMSLPPDRKNVDEVEKEIRRIVDRALRDLRDDFQQFGHTPPTAG